jgi:hypothetical protein
MWRMVVDALIASRVRMAEIMPSRYGRPGVFSGGMWDGRRSG